MSDALICFRSLDWYRIEGRGDVAIVLCEQERPRDGSGLIGSTVDIDDVLYTIKGVERFALAGPIRKGERIGLLVWPSFAAQDPNTNQTGHA